MVVTATPRELDTSELVELLQQSAVEHLTVFRQFEEHKFGSISTECAVVTTDFEALYAYICCEYQRCLQLSTQNVLTLSRVRSISCVTIFPEFIQLMDDDIVSLIGLHVINLSYREKYPSVGVLTSQLPLSLYLMTQCQMKLHHSVTSLAQTLDYVAVAYPFKVYELDQLLLKPTQRKILLYIRRKLV